MNTGGSCNRNYCMTGHNNILYTCTYLNLKTIKVELQLSSHGYCAKITGFIMILCFKYLFNVTANTCLFEFVTLMYNYIITQTVITQREANPTAMLDIYHEITFPMITPWHGNDCCITDPLWGESVSDPLWFLREISKPRYISFGLSDRSEIWGA